MPCSRIRSCRFAGLLFVALLVSGCGTGGLIALEGASVMASDKTASDHLVSLMSGKDCSVVRSEQGLAYCVEDQAPILAPKYYCYKTLGSVSCYDRPDPRRSPDQLIGRDEHNFAQ